MSYLNQPSAEQKRIFKEFEIGRDNFVVEALAGTGKSTTIENGIPFAPEREILVGAFNKKIEIAMTRRIAHIKSAKSKTFHALGLGMTKRFWPDVEVDFEGGRAEQLTDAVVGGRAPDTVKRLITKLHTMGREINPHARSVGDLADIAFQFDCVPDPNLGEDFDLTYVEEHALAAMELAATVKPRFIDGADMIFLPCRNHWIRRTKDLVVVDEYQDMNMPQLEMALGLTKGRLVLVGDKHQAIYAFRGADSEGIERLKAELKAKELPLTVTYRCGKAIVTVAQQFVPSFQAGPKNGDGQVLDLEYEKMLDQADHGDFVLSRLNAPLMRVAMALLRRGKRARIPGRNIGEQLISLTNRLSRRTKDIVAFISAVKQWEEKQTERLLAAKQEKKLEETRDKAAMLIELAEEFDTVDAVCRRIQYLFSDDDQGDANLVVCSSVHKSKGLEANRVFVLKDSLRNNNQEELNIHYVAVTRAKETLVMVQGGVN